MNESIALLERQETAPKDFAAELAAQLQPDTVIRPEEPLARRTTLRVGGPADVYVEPATEADLAVILEFCGEHSLPFFVLGRGSNFLVRDGGFRGVVICLAQPLFSRIEIADDQLHCGAGAKLKLVAVEAARHGLAGLEFLEGIPGTVGGALRMNAGAMGGTTFQVVESVRLMDFTGRVHERSPRDLAVEYRSCRTFETHIALGAVLRGQPDLRERIQERMTQFSRRRWKTQPAAPSAGCIFKNPPALPAGRLIEELGLKGTRVGRAAVSDAHGNFIVTERGATAQDVLMLVELIQQRARAERGIELEPEVQIIGE